MEDVLCVEDRRCFNVDMLTGQKDIGAESATIISVCSAGKTARNIVDAASLRLAKDEMIDDIAQLGWKRQQQVQLLTWRRSTLVAQHSGAIEC